MTGEPSIIPIKDYTYPKEGKRSLQYTVDLSNQAAVVDLVNIAQMGQMSQIPSIFFDNADNDFSVTMVMEGTFQRIVCPPKSQGYIRLLLPQKPRLGFSSEQPCQFKVNFLNFVVEELTIWKVSDVSGGGTVTSVGLDMPVEFDVTGSPITSAGTFGVTWASELANKVFAAPNGVPGIPSFRSLVAADIPSVPVSTRTILTMGSSNYNPPVTCRQIKIRMIGGGGGGMGDNSGTGSIGTATSFNGIVANPGKGGAYGATNSGNGAGVANLRLVGSMGSYGSSAITSTLTGFGGAGGAGIFGSGSGAPGVGNLTAGGAGGTNTGAGGGGGGHDNTANLGTGIGGNAGEYVEIIINNPISSYAYVIGSGGNGGAGSTSASAGGNGGSGIIIIDEFY